MNAQMIEAAFRAISVAYKEQGFRIKARALTTGPERQILIMSVEKGSESAAVIVKLDHISRKDIQQPMTDFEGQTFWHGYSCGISETATAMLQALGGDYRGLDGLHEENPDAQLDLEILCKAMGADEIAKQLRRRSER